MSEVELQALVRSIEELREANAELREFQRRSREETDRAMQASADERDRTDEAIRKLSGEFSSQWGDLAEALVEPGLVGQFQARGVPITQSTRRMEGIDQAGRQVEIDVLLVNGDAVVAIEVKTKCKVDDIIDFEETLGRFREAFRQYSGHRLLAGVAAVTFDSDCDRYAYKRGMFVLKPIAGIAQILNDEGFVPKEF